MKMTIIRKSNISGTEGSMILELTEEQLAELQMPGRRAIQDIVPHLNAGEREFLVSGITPAEWSKIFGD